MMPEEIETMEPVIPDRLQEILLWKQKEIERSKEKNPLRNLMKTANQVAKTRNCFSFRNALAQNDDGIQIIAEIKRASPSKGIIRADFDVQLQAKTYESAGASAISVLTEEKFFHGSLKDLQEVKESVNVPILRKDFIFDPYQIYESAVCNADALLLIARILTYQELKDFLDLAGGLWLDTLVEIHDENDLEKALKVNAPIIGINNRDLSTFTVSLETTLRLARFIDPHRHIIVSESGIRNREDVELIVSGAGVRCFLIGESLMKSDDPAGEIRKLKGVRS